MKYNSENIISFITDGFNLTNFVVFLVLTFLLVLFIGFLKSILIKLNKLELGLKEEIKTSVQTKFIEASIEAKDLIDLAIEVWKINQRLTKAAKQLNENSRKSLEISIQKINKFTDKYDLEVRDYTGQKYNAGLSAVDIISVEKDKTAKEDTIKQTLEPAVLIKGQLIKKAKVILLSKK